jgi:hypothetical protein
VKDLYDKHYKTGGKTLKKLIKRGKDVPGSQISKINVKMAMLTKAIYRFGHSSQKQKSLKIHVEAHENNTGDIIIPDFKLYCRAIMTKTACYWHKNQRNRKEDPEINPHSHSHLTLDKGTKKYAGEKTASSTNGAGKNEISTCRRLKIDSHLSSVQKSI